MRNLLVLTLGLLFTMTFAQRHELGLFAGGSNVIGDIGKSNYINPMPMFSSEQGDMFDKVPLAFGALYRFNVNPHMGLRANILFGRVLGDDGIANESYKKERNYYYKNSIVEASILFEYNFFDINDEHGKKHSPYIFGGIGAFMYNENKYTVNQNFLRDDNGVIIGPTEIDTEIISNAQKKTSYTLPIGVGYKLRIAHDFILSGEVGFRYTKTDNLDFSFANESDFTFNNEPGLDPDTLDQLNQNIIKSRQVGNMSNYDWYVFTGITLTYTFGRPPCYCD